jgi:hypothetical protein
MQGLRSNTPANQYTKAMLASTLSNSSVHRPSRRWSLVFGALLLTLLAHLLVLQWLKNQLESIPFFDDADDESAISVSLLRPDPQRSAPSARKLTPPAPPLAPPVPAIAANDQVAVADKPATEATSVAPIPSTEAPPPANADTTTSATPASVPGAATDPNATVAPAQETAFANINAVFDKANPPPPAELVFNAIGVSKDGRSLSGNGTMQWRHDGQRYTLDTEISVLVFTLAKNRSEGELGALGIAPNLYIEKRFGRSETNTHFQQQSKQISFSASTAIIPANGGEQDRGSWIWQLASLGRGNPGKFESGLNLEMFVAGAKSVDAWRIRVNGKEQLKLPDGEVSAWRLSVVPGTQSFDKQFDLWLAPDRQWYPVRLLHEDKNGNRVELSLSKISSK